MTETERKFKVGDIVRCVRRSNTNPINSWIAEPEYGVGWVEGRVFKIKNISDYPHKTVLWPDTSYTTSTFQNHGVYACGVELVDSPDKYKDIIIKTTNKATVYFIM